LEFDASTFEIWGALLNGLTLVLIEKENILAPDELKKIIPAYRITIMWMTSPLFNQMVQNDPAVFAGIQNLLVGGDVLSPQHINMVKKRFSRMKIINGYGPTENTTFSTTFAIEAEYQNHIPIGKPIANSYVYIMDKNNHLQPVGIVGELWLGGDGIARGYLNKPELTASRFTGCRLPVAGHQSEIKNINRSSLPTFFQESRNPKLKRGCTPGFKQNSKLDSYAKLYKTGDLGRWLSDGNIEFLGRIDHQVKIRGFRIEPQEIEIGLLSHSLVKEAVVLIKQEKSGDKYLCAYIVSERGLLDTGEIRDYLSQSLPDYMIPSYFIFMEKLPLNPNGKIDRKALPEPVVSKGESYVGPRNFIEEKLVEIWNDILCRDAKCDCLIGIDDNFFELGGHSIKATLLVSKVQKKFNVSIPLTEVFSAPSIRELAQFIENASEDKYISLESAEKKVYYALSSAQKRLYLLHQMDRTFTAYNMTEVIRIQGEFDKARMEDAFLKSIRRHEILRTSFEYISGRLVQVIHDDVEFKVEYREMEFEEGSSSSREEVNKFIRPFDLSKAPLMRAGLIKTGESIYILVVDMHHIISDGVSVEIFTREFTAFYEGKVLPELVLQYRDYSEWQQNNINSRSLVKQQEYWMNEFESNGEIPVLQLPADYVRPAIQGFEGKTKYFSIGIEETAGLRKIAAEEGVTLFMLSISIYYIFLSRLTGQEDIVVGTPATGRRHADLESIMGMFVNTLALRAYPIGTKFFKEFLQEVKEKVIKASENQDYQYEDLVESVVINRDASRNPLFDAGFSLRPVDMDRVQLPGLKIKTLEFETGVSKFDLTLTVLESGEELSSRLEYSTNLFKDNSIERFTDFFKKLVSEIVADAGKKLCEIDILSEQERNTLLYDFNDTHADYPKDKTIHGLFEEQVERTPDNIALVYLSRQITYSEFDEKSNGLAYELKEKGIQPDVIVGIKMARSIELVIGILGILKSGGAYLPIDPDYPRDRIDFMLEDSDAKILLATEDTEVTEGVAPLAIRELKNIITGQASFIPNKTSVSSVSSVAKNSLAYIIYTSGSTGKPKGVMVEHGSIFNTIYWRMNEYKMGTGDKILQLFSVAFDGFLTSFFTPIVSGAVVVQPGNDEIRDISKLKEVIISRRITHFLCVPSLFRSLMETGSVGGNEFSALKVVTLAGEQVSPGIIEMSKRSNPGLKITDEYGPTESSVLVSINRDVYPGEVIPIGKPIANVGIYILDNNGC
jgi:amino acid adenylation domain-containing protein